MPYRLPRVLHVNRDYTKIVEETDPEVAFVLGGPGTVISDELAVQLGLKGGDPESAEKAQPAPGNKRHQPGDNKGDGVIVPPAKKESEDTAVVTDTAVSIDNDPLPDDFPAVEFLRETGLTTYTAVREYDQPLTTIKGIGKVYANKIRSALAHG